MQNTFQLLEIIAKGWGMFGYVLPEKPELKVKEYELFRAYYCGVCKSIGRRYGQLKRLLLNYDSTFLAVLLAAVAGEIPSVGKERCIAHPVVKRHIAGKSAIIDYASDIDILLAYYNLDDKRRDDGSLPAATAMLLLKRAYGKLKKKYTEKCDIIESRLAELHRLESEGCPSMDRAAEPFARLMEEVTAYGPLCETEKSGKALRWIGYNLGKWIYLLDAFDDLEKDIKNKSYNPLLKQYKYENEDIIEFKSRIRERVEFNLTYSLNQIAAAYELLEVKSNRGILENIVYLGLLRKTENILGMGRCNQLEQSV